MQRVIALGGLSVHAPGDARDLVAGLGPRPRLLLGLLCLQPRGPALADAMAALWPGVPDDRAAVRFHATLAQLRRALSGQLPGQAPGVTYLDARYQLHETITVDLWDLQLADQIAHQPGTAEEQRQAALRTITTLYTGPLLNGLDAEWLEAPREATRRTALNALVALARHHHQDNDPEQALALLDQAIAHDPYAEQLYQHIMRLQAKLGRIDAVTRTHRLLRTPRRARP